MTLLWLVLPVQGHSEVPLAAAPDLPGDCCQLNLLCFFWTKKSNYLSKICGFKIIYSTFLSIVPLIHFLSACPSANCSSNQSNNYFSVSHWQINVTIFQNYNHDSHWFSCLTQIPLWCWLTSVKFGGDPTLTVPANRIFLSLTALNLQPPDGISSLCRSL